MLVFSFGIEFLELDLTLFQPVHYENSAKYFLVNLRKVCHLQTPFN